jgi:hypothetical protein
MVSTISENKKSRNFYRTDWTAQISLKVLAKIDLARNGFSGRFREASCAARQDRTDLPVAHRQVVEFGGVE